MHGYYWSIRESAYATDVMFKDAAALRRIYPSLLDRTTRLLRLLRAHGLIRKVSGTRYYRVTRQGHQTMSAALILRAADVTKLAA